eukprot:SM000236S08017  [mRNA]  locus=s236:160989:168163:- [translate_table: standard]
MDASAGRPAPRPYLYTPPSSSSLARPLSCCWPTPPPADGAPARGHSRPTTLGVWLGLAAGISPTLVIDIEGTDKRGRSEVRRSRQTAVQFAVVPATVSEVTVLLRSEAVAGWWRAGPDARSDDEAFEKQTALFAVAVSDIVISHAALAAAARWCHNIGREKAANRPLLKTVFQAMLRLCTPGKMTLLFAIRDKTRTPLEMLEPILRGDIQKVSPQKPPGHLSSSAPLLLQALPTPALLATHGCPLALLECRLRFTTPQIWDSVVKPEQYAAVPLSNIFNVEVTALANFEDEEELFQEQLVELRARFYTAMVPGGWQDASTNSNRGLHSPKVCRECDNKHERITWSALQRLCRKCGAILDTHSLNHLQIDIPENRPQWPLGSALGTGWACCGIEARQPDVTRWHEWRDLDEAARARVLSLLWLLCIYDAEAAYFDEGVRSSQRKLLLLAIGKLVQPAYTATVAHHRTAALVAFKEALDWQLATDNDVPFAEAANAAMRAAVEHF